MLLDLERQTTVADEGNFTKVGWSPYAGRTLTGAVHLTMLRGRVVAEERQVFAEPGSGRYIAGTPQ